MSRRPADAASSCAARSRGSLARLLIAPLIVLLFASYAPASDTQDGGRLDWANGDSLPGEPIGASATHIHWRSPILGDPISIDINKLKSIEFPRSEAPAESEPLEFLTHSGDVLRGQLVDVTDDQLVLESHRHGTVKLARTAVRSFRRRDMAPLKYIGPKGLAGWRALKDARQISHWKVNEKGQPSTGVVGANLFRDLKLPPVAEIEIALRWDRKPGFMITFAPPDAHELSLDNVRLETWDDEVVAQTLTFNGEFEPIETLADGVQSVHYRLLWNQPAGQLAVYSQTGKLLAKIAGGSAEGHSGLYIQNKGAGLTVVDVRVNRLRGGTPGEDRDGQASVRLVDGRSVDGQVLGLDKPSRSLELRDASGRARPIAMDQIAGVYLGDRQAAEDPEAKPQLRLSYRDGTRLSGTLHSLKDGHLFLRIPSAAGPVASRLAGAEQLTFLASRAEDTPRVTDVLTLQGHTLHGHLAPAGDDGSALGWRPLGSANVVSIDRDQAVRIIRAAKPLAGLAHAAEHTDVIYMTNGDFAACRVTAIDSMHVSAETPFGRVVRIPQGKVKAVEFNTAESRGISGLDDRGWVVSGNEEGAVERAAERAVFHGPASLGHAQAMWGDQVAFDLQWNTTVRTSMTIGLYTRDARRASSSHSLLLYFMKEDGVFARLLQGGNERFVAVRGPSRERNGPAIASYDRARLKMNVESGRIQLSIDQKLILSETIIGEKKSRAGQGIVLAVGQLDKGKPLGRGREQEQLLVISNFRVGRMGGPFGGIAMDEQKKELVLTVPRNRKTNPPTHLLVARNGDLLRGHLKQLTGKTVHFTSQLNDLSLPIDRLAGMIWFHPDGDAAAGTEPPEGHVVRATFLSGTRLTLSGAAFEQEELVGQHETMGICRLPLDAINELNMGRVEAGTRHVAYSDWKLRPAKEPQFASTAGSSSGGSDADSPFGIDSPLVGTAAKDFSAESLDGAMFQLAAHSDKVVVLDFWATWCGPCVKALPETIEAVGAFSPDDVILIAVNYKENKSTIREFLDARGWTMQVVMDRDGQIGRQFQVDSLPQTVVIGRGGRIERLHVGDRGDLHEALSGVLRDLLGGVREGEAPAEPRREGGR